MILKRVIHIIVLVLAALPAVTCRAQADLPREIVEASELTEAQRTALKQYVDANDDGLSEGHAAVKKSRNALIRPLQGSTRVSVAFRLEYARLLTPVLRPLSRGERDYNAINALRLAGELATTSSIEILSEALTDKRLGVRFEAVTGFASTFGAIEATAPAIAPAQQAIRALDTLKSNMEKETNPKVLEAYTLAFDAARKVPTAKLAGVRPAAITALSTVIGAKAQKTSDASLDAVFGRAVNATRVALTVQAINEPVLEPAVLESAAGMAGDLLACIHRRIKAGELAGEDVETNTRTRASFVLIAADAERTFQWANTGRGGTAAVDLKLSELLQQDKDEAFQNDVMRLIGPNGALTASPFPFANDRFVK